MIALKDYRVEVVLVIIFCFFLLGIVVLIYFYRVSFLNVLRFNVWWWFFEINKLMLFKVRKKKEYCRFFVLLKGFLFYICYYKILIKFLGMIFVLILRRGFYRVVFSYFILFYRWNIIIRIIDWLSYIYCLRLFKFWVLWLLLLVWFFGLVELFFIWYKDN